MSLESNMKAIQTEKDTFKCCVGPWGPASDRGHTNGNDVLNGMEKRDGHSSCYVMTVQECTACPERSPLRDQDGTCCFEPVIGKKKDALQSSIRGRTRTAGGSRAAVLVLFGGTLTDVNGAERHFEPTPHRDNIP
ncbi:hypothetical protein JOQ06_017469, partial [Pogonophryne albipinna]